MAGSACNLTASALFGLQNKIALVTGGGRGIGKMIAQGLVQNGVKVYIASRSADACAAAAQELTSIGPGQCFSIPADLSTEAGCKDLVASLKSKENALHILVNNSGTSWGEPLEKHSDKGFDKVYALNVKAPFFVTRECLPLLDNAATKEDPARVIMIGSIAGIMPQLFPTYAYDCSKASIHMLTRKLSGELARRPGNKKITVNAIAPGYVPSKMTAQLSAYATEEGFDETIPLSRRGTPEDMAGAAIYLSSRAAAWVTGAIIPVDGGMTAQPPPPVAVAHL